MVGSLTYSYKLLCAASVTSGCSSNKRPSVCLDNAMGVVSVIEFVHDRYKNYHAHLSRLHLLSGRVEFPGKS